MSWSEAGKTITITRKGESPDDLLRTARLSKTVAQARRLLAIAFVLEGHSRTTAAGMDWQSLRDWAHRFNAEGPTGLVDKPRSGRPPLMAAAQLQALNATVETGPAVDTDGVVRGCRADLQRVIADHCGVALCERSVGRILKARGFRHASVRPQHPKSDLEAQALSQKALRTR